ncbi:MAG: DNA repair protein RecO [Gammaproteobacteria bacterium]|jgi:DNA repair protein RecO (recombination protein O)
MSSRTAIDSEPVFLLHQRPYQNSSQLLEVLSLHYGRVGLIAQGSRRPGRGMRALLQPFIPLRLSWIRRGELGRITNVEAGSSAIELPGAALLAGYYANELVISLTSRDDPAAELFAHYTTCLNALASDANVARNLRLFEHRLLGALGFGLQLDIDCASGAPLFADREYAFSLDEGARPSSGQPGYRGADLISLREERLEDAGSLRAARQLLGEAIARQLGARRLKTRDVLREIDARGLIV